MPVWVDTHAKTIIEGWTEYDPVNCVTISPGSFTILANPVHGQLFFDVENFMLGNGDCPGVIFQFAIARYTWTGPTQGAIQDPFTLRWTTPDGMFIQDNSFMAELAQIKQAKSVWWVCGATRPALPHNVVIRLTNPPSGASSFVWTVTAGSDKLVFTNGTATTTTSTNTATVKSLAASAALKDVGVKVTVQNLTYAFHTEVRTPEALKRRTDLDQDNGRGANCTVAGTQGWQSLIGYEVDDQFGVNTSSPDNADAGINEKFGTKTDLQVNDWPIPSEGGSNTTGGLFSDNMCITTTAFNPNPKPPQHPLTTNKVDRIAQTWFAGDSTTPANHKGCKVQTDAFTRFIDHGRHLSIVSPPALGGPGEQATAAIGAAGYPMPVLNVRYLAGQSAVIVKGRVLTVNQLGSIKQQTANGTLTFRQMTASVRVDEILKGKVEGGVVAVEFLKNPDVLATNLEENEYALLFLTVGKDGRYMFADPQTGKMPITSQKVPSAATAGTTADKLEAELFASLADPDREVARAALIQVANLGTVRSTQPLRNIASSSDPDFQGLAYIALLRLGDYSLLDRAIQYAAQPVPDLEMRRRQAGVAEAIGDIRDRSVLPTLNSLLASPSVILRRAAAKALRAMSDPSSAPFLARTLKDGDADVQYDVMMALATLAGASPDNSPSRSAFSQDPAKYLGYWSNWWETAGKQRYAPSH